MRKRKKLTEDDWAEVFLVRCKAKQGQPLTKEESALCNVAFESDNERYKMMEKDVFNATVPFGSNVKL